MNKLVTYILGAEAIIYGSIICLLLFGLNIVSIAKITRQYLSYFIFTDEFIHSNDLHSHVHRHNALCAIHLLQSGQRVGH